MEIITAASGNSYIYEQRTGYISLVPSSYMSKGTLSSYYSDKIKYLTKFGLISNKSELEFKYKLLEKKDITNALISNILWDSSILLSSNSCRLSTLYRM